LEFNIWSLIILFSFFLVLTIIVITILLKPDKTTFLIVSLFVIFAIPILFSLYSIPFSLISIGTLKVWNVVSILFLIAMILAGTYLVTYIISLIFTLKNKKLSFLSFLPMAHIILFLLSMFLSQWFEKHITK